MKDGDIFICDILESRIDEDKLKINQTNCIMEANLLHSELRILDWTLELFYSNEIKLDRL